MTTERAAAEDEARAAAAAGFDQGFVERMIERVGGRAGVTAVFGEPIERGDLTVVPVARMRWAFGGGSGGAVPAGPGEAGAGGSGGGGGVAGDPVGFLEIGPAGATFRPIVPPYPSPVFVLVAGMTVALMVRALARLVRG